MRLATLTLFVSLLATPLLALDGAWTAALQDDRDHVYFAMTTGPHHNDATTMTLASFTNLTPSQVNAAAMTPVNFELRREAGSFSFEGTFRNGKGAGQFTFAPERSYIDKLRALGVPFELGKSRHREISVDEKLYVLAQNDVSTSFIKSMQSLGYRTTLEKYLAMRIFNITPEYVREMESLGFGKIDQDDLVSSKIQGVTPKFVRDMRTAGWKLSLEEYQAARIHGATPEFAAEMKRLGYPDLAFNHIVSFRIHGVTAEFITALRALGYDHVSPDDLVAMRIHGVTPEYIKELRGAGYEKVPVRKLVEMRIHGIDAKMVKAMSN